MLNLAEKEDFKALLFYYIVIDSSKKYSQRIKEDTITISHQIKNIIKNIEILC